MHSLFVATMSNPFAQLNAKIESPRFDQQLTKHAAGYEKKSSGGS